MIRSVCAAMKPSVEYPSSIGSSGAPTCSIWNQWSITVKFEQPPSSAARAVAASVGAIESGPPASAKFG